MNDRAVSLIRRFAPCRQLSAVTDWFSLRTRYINSHAVGGFVSGAVMSPLVMRTMRAVPVGAAAGAVAGAALGVAEYEFEGWVEEQRR